MYTKCNPFIEINTEYTRVEHKLLFFLTPYIFHQFLTHNFYSKVKFKIHHFTFRFELSSGFPTFDFLERIFDFAKQSPRLRKRRGRSGIEQPSSGAHGIGTDSRELLVKYLPWAMLAPIRYISRTRDIISTQLLFLPFSSSCGECNRSNFNERPLGIQRPNQNFTSNFRNDVFEQVEVNYRYRTNGRFEKVFYSPNDIKHSVSVFTGKGLWSVQRSRHLTRAWCGALIGGIKAWNGQLHGI